ncbi:MAG: hypothetical protein KF852_12130 [Saprospiraceae bacterium]|nr:hypothetical protein [Saprospiraceae bacterium]
MNAGSIGNIALFFVLSSLHLLAQPGRGGQPLGLQPAFTEFLSDLPEHRLLPPDVEKFRREDQQGTGFRVAAPVLADLDLTNAGYWTELPNGDRFWTLKIQAPGAKGLAAMYDQVVLPQGAKLFMYDADGRQILGAFTHRNISRTGRFMTGFLHGETALIEYFEPAAQRGQGSLRIFRFDYAYESLAYEQEKSSATLNDFEFGASWDCHPNIACPPGDTMSHEERSACRIIVVVEEGSGYCTGTVINNTRNNGVPYVITGFHCMDGFTPLWDLWRFDFGYQGESCANPAEEPAYQSILGCDNRAGRRQNDFLLLELFSSIPTSYNVFFAGWDRGNAVPARSVYMHHPLGDIKKISIDTQAAIVQNTQITWNNGVVTPTAHHFRVLPDIGSFQVGSSGAGLFNQNKRFVGQLHGGSSSCDNTTAYFGRMSLAWNGGGSSITRLKDWLDPDNTDSTAIAGIENPAAPGISVSGTIQTEGGIGIAGVRVYLEGADADTIITDASGQFTFEAVEGGEEYTLHFLKDTNYINGVSTLDAIQIQRRILNVGALGSPYKVLAADVNASGQITTMDLIILRRLILSLSSNFEEVTSWQFFPANHPFSNPVDPFGELVPNRVALGLVQQDVLVQITGIKSGDINESADPAN